MVALDGLLDPEASQIVLAALEPLTRPANAADERSAGQRRADGLAGLARRTLEAGQLPQTGGVRPQLTVTVDLASLLDCPPRPGVRPIICATGCTGARPTWPTWRWYAGLIIGPCMRAAGGCIATPTGG